MIGVMAQLRQARTEDTTAICDVFAASRAAGLPFLPVIHGPDEDLAFFGGLVEHGWTTVAEEDGAIVGFLVLSESRLEHLYVHPDHWRRAIGSQLLHKAQAARPGGFDLWVFQRNGAAIAFYERHGMQVAETTDGADNEELEPDALMVWLGG
jgi:ribosomal protein S18 acetylase RimI-like enzyme